MARHHGVFPAVLRQALVDVFQARVLNLLATPASQARGLGWGCVLLGRAPNEFGLVTSGGESVYLTGDLLWGARNVPFLLSGVVPAYLTAPTQPDRDARPVGAIRVGCLVGGPGAAFHHVGLYTPTKLARFGHPILLRPRRPDGWPR